MYDEKIDLGSSHQADALRGGVCGSVSRRIHMNVIDSVVRKRPTVRELYSLSAFSVSSFSHLSTVLTMRLQMNRAARHHIVHSK